MRHHAAVFALLIALGAAPSTDADPSVSEYCATSGPEMDLQNVLFDAGSESSRMLALASGHVEDVRDEIGRSIAAQISRLTVFLASNPCGIDQRALSKINPMLRVIAAANHRTPIPHVSNDQKLMGILAKAIADDPKHYEQLLSRSQNWDNGIK